MTDKIVKRAQKGMRVRYIGWFVQRDPSDKVLVRPEATGTICDQREFFAGCGKPNPSFVGVKWDNGEHCAVFKRELERV